ncbi:hypothetical protein EA462_08980 [Natrarchaeobius halalkaliphilus]|uniref:Uncharacterized protein n=1 Tax=Natrarchaeobius halalkaliphilus TaxID=1679091 RepID=A0A3N6LMA3_9EURY|nr:hypothetical protein [Natrarchaeobius halalkaliphilus]RQG90118.1 hypothetical protein EA462_08980 [Natrarchaeobius halalkaliphilus]
MVDADFESRVDDGDVDDHSLVVTDQDSSPIPNRRENTKTKPAINDLGVRRAVVSGTVPRNPALTSEPTRSTVSIPHLRQ